MNKKYKMGRDAEKKKEKERLAKEDPEMEKINKSAMEKQMNKKTLLKEEKVRLDKEMKISDSLIIEVNNHF